MAAIQVEAGTPLAAQIQSAVQPKLIELGWSAEENDTTLSEYITVMLVNGKDVQGVQSEIGNELLGMGEEDPAVKEFSAWLFETVHKMVTSHYAPQHAPTQSDFVQAQTQPEMPTADSQMHDAAATPADGVPSGPKAMRNGSETARGRARGGRMLGQMNRQMDRSHETPDSLRRIKGAASGHAGRINAHANRDHPPRAPRGQDLTNGVQRMMNGGGRGGQQHMNPAMQAATMGQLAPEQQMMFMQMMEMQANMMANMLQNGQMPTTDGSGSRGGRSLADRMDSRGRGNANGHRGGRHQHTPKFQDGDTMMETDEPGEKKAPFETLCHYNLGCTNPSCKFAHQSPAAPPGTTVDMADTCSHGAACTNKKCTGRHPSPAQRQAYQKSDVECKFYPNCAMGSACPFKHPDMPPCRNGPDCQVEGCKFSHSKIMCRYNPCLNPSCQYRHQEGQKRGKFDDKVWTAGEQDEDTTGAAEGKSERFAELKQNENQPEELIVPGQTQQSEAQQPDGEMVT